MSIPVPLPELADALTQRPWGYLLTVGDDQRAKTLAVPTDFVDGLLRASGGSITRANAAARPAVTMVFPPVAAGDYSLIVDGDAELDGETVVVRPTWAVLHRPATPA